MIRVLSGLVLQLALAAQAETLTGRVVAVSRRRDTLTVRVDGRRAVKVRLGGATRRNAIRRSGSAAGGVWRNWRSIRR